MAIAKWGTPSSRSSNFAGSSLNSLSNGSESTGVTYDNSTNRDLYGLVTLKLGGITGAAGGSVTIRTTLNDGTDTADRIGGDLYVVPLTTGFSAKTSIVNMVRLYPYNMTFSVINNSGITFAASGNELYVRPWNEDVT